MNISFKKFGSIWFFLLWISISVNAQNEQYIYSNGVFNFSENKNQKVFTNWSRIREKPSAEGIIIDSLTSNSVVKIIKNTEVLLKLGERSSNWYLISYTSENSEKQGYIWGGNLCIGYHHKNGEDFLFGLGKSEKRTNENGNTYQTNIASIKRMSRHQILDEVFFETGIGESLGSASFTLDNPHELQNVEFMISALVSGEACGIPSYQNIFLFNKNKKMIPLPQLTNIGDADIFYDSETFIFPDQEGGIKNTIILDKEKMERDEQDREIKSGEKIIFLWNGSLLSESKKQISFTESPTP